MRKEERWKKEREESLQKRQLVKALLVASMTDTEYYFVSINACIFSQLINGVLAHTRSVPCDIRYPQGFHEAGAFEKQYLQVYQQHMRRSPRAQQLVLKPALDVLLDYEYSYDGHGESSGKCRLYNILNGPGGIFSEGMFQAVTSLPYAIVHHAQRTIIPELPSEMRQEVQQLGKAIRPFIEYDVETLEGRKHNGI